MGVANMCKKCDLIQKTQRKIKAFSAGGKATDRTSKGNKLTSYSNTVDYRFEEHAICDVQRNVEVLTCKIN